MRDTGFGNGEKSGERPLLDCRGVTRRPWFTGRALTVDAGEIVVLRGATGSGKSLLLRGIADLDPVDEGSFLLDGEARDAVSPSRWRRSVLYLHQSAPRLAGTVRENLDRVARLVSHSPEPPPPLPRLSLEQEAERLSGGEAQLLALHRAFLVSPRVLLLDEGTSALDSATARAVEETLQAWVGAGHGIVWVSHDDTLATRLGVREEELVR